MEHGRERRASAAFGRNLLVFEADAINRGIYTYLNRLHKWIMSVSWADDIGVLWEFELKLSDCYTRESDSE